jgi:hypothetical protein
MYIVAQLMVPERISEWFWDVAELRKREDILHILWHFDLDFPQLDTRKRKLSEDGSGDESL